MNDTQACPYCSHDSGGDVSELQRTVHTSSEDEPVSQNTEFGKHYFSLAVGKAAGESQSPERTLMG